ncbi:MAG: N-acetylglucosamine-6-phosphate deacetylase [Erysipelothrix sp.]|nr:N-acetylglucosamine-6-phosphate deacetylase [Erysipelothrix sp.]
MIIYSNNIVTPDKVLKGYINIENGKITAINSCCNSPFLDLKDAIILPGFIDQHTHGWGRGSFFYENDINSLKMMIEDQAKEGVTGFLATTFTDALPSIFQSIDAANAVYNEKIKGSKLLGVHLEGPFISKEFKGAQKEEACLEPSLDLLKEFIARQKDKSMIKLMTIAPELKGAKEVIEYCRDNNIQISAGHTGADFETLIESKKWGVSGVTHMYSAMRSLHHRNPGVVGAALYDKDIYCEFAKQTGITVRHEVFDLTYRLKGADKIIMTTDALGNGKQKEAYYHATRDVDFIPEKDKLIERSRKDGSEIIYDLNDYESIRKIELSYIDSIRNMMNHSDISWIDLSKMVATNSAKYLGIDNERGSIEAGKYADLTIITPDIDLLLTIVEGEIVHSNIEGVS